MQTLGKESSQLSLESQDIGTDSVHGRCDDVELGRTRLSNDGLDGLQGALQPQPVVLLKSGPPTANATTLLLHMLQAGYSTKAAAKEAAQLVAGLSKKEAYALALQLAEGIRNTSS